MKNKIIAAIITLFLVSLILSSTLFGVYAALGVDNPEDYINQGNTNIGQGEMKTIGSTIVGIVRAIGTALAVIIIMIIGIKYILGSVEERAQYKQTVMPYIIGAILLFGGAQVTGIIYDAVHR